MAAEIKLVDMKLNPTNLVAIVDDGDLERISKHKWFLDPSGKPVSKFVNLETGAFFRQSMAREVLNIRPGDNKMVYYVNTSDKKNCQKTNLVIEERKVGARIHTTPNGKQWPLTKKNFENYVQSYCDKVSDVEFELEYKATVSDLLDLICNAEIKWSKHRGIFKYQRNSPTLHKVRQAPFSTLVERFVRKEFAETEWVFAITEDLLSDPWESPLDKANRKQKEQERAAKAAEEAAKKAEEAAKKAEEAAKTEEANKAKAEADKAVAANHIEGVHQRYPRLARTYTAPKRSELDDTLDALPLEAIIAQIKKRGGEVRF